LSESASGPADITIEQFHELADHYLEALIEKLEALQEETEEVDVEYSVCVPLAALVFPSEEIEILELFANGIYL
jgi:frataxin